MASGYNPGTVRRIYDAIAEAKEAGLDLQQLTHRLGLNRNTVLIYTRRMEAEGVLEIYEERGPSGHYKNVYVAAAPPLAEVDKLRLIAELLRSTLLASNRPEINRPIQQAIAIATGKH